MVKRIFILLVMLSVLFCSCGKEKEVIDGVLFTNGEIVFDFISIDYTECNTQNVVIIENEEQLSSINAENEGYYQLSILKDLMASYPLNKYTYVMQFARTSNIGQTLTCDGIVINKEKKRIYFHYNLEEKKEKGIFDEDRWYFAYAIFPKDELRGYDFSELDYVEYPGEK